MTREKDAQKTYLFEGGGQGADAVAGGGELVEDGDDLGVGARHRPDRIVAVDVGECCLGVDLWLLLSTRGRSLELDTGKLGGEEAELGGVDVADEVAEGGVEDGIGEGRWGEGGRGGDAYRLGVGS